MYNPEKNYTWDKDEKIVLTGAQFGLVLNTLRAILSTEQAAQILLADRTNMILEGIIAENIEKGIFKEVNEQPNTEQNGNS